MLLLSLFPDILRTGNLSDADWEKLVEGAGIIGDSELIIDDTPGISISELRSKCRKYKLEHDLKLVIIDYLQLMTGSGRGSESRQQEIQTYHVHLRHSPESFQSLWWHSHSSHEQ